jgi:hypothetical protein
MRLCVVRIEIKCMPDKGFCALFIDSRRSAPSVDDVPREYPGEPNHGIDRASVDLKGALEEA